MAGFVRSALSLAILVAARAFKVQFQNVYTDKLAVFMHVPDAEGTANHTQLFGFERLLTVIPPNHMSSVEETQDVTFVIRSADFNVAVRVGVRKSKSGDFPSIQGMFDRPYVLEFTNLNGDPAKAIELKHSTSGFVWIPSQGSLAQATDMGHPFQMNDENTAPIFITELPAADEL